MSQRTGFPSDGPMARENELSGGGGGGGTGLFQNLLVSPIAKIYSPNASIDVSVVYLLH